MLIAGHVVSLARSDVASKSDWKIDLLIRLIEVRRYVTVASIVALIHTVTHGYSG